MRAAAGWLRRRLRRRGLYLLVAGAGWLLYGVQVVQDPRPGTVRSAVVMRELAPIAVWGWVWIACSVVAIGCAFSRCPVRQTVGFSAAIFPPLLWALAFAGAWLSGDYPQAWAGAATWMGAALRLIIVAGWPEPAAVVTEVARE